MDGPRRRRPIGSIEEEDDSEDYEMEALPEGYDPLAGLLLAVRMGRKAKRSKRDFRMTTTPRLRRILKVRGELDRMQSRKTNKQRL